MIFHSLSWPPQLSVGFCVKPRMSPCEAFDPYDLPLGGLASQCPRCHKRIRQTGRILPSSGRGAYGGCPRESVLDLPWDHCTSGFVPRSSQRRFGGHRKVVFCLGLMFWPFGADLSGPWLRNFCYVQRALSDQRPIKGCGVVPMRCTVCAYGRLPGFLSRGFIIAGVYGGYSKDEYESEIDEIR